MYIIIWTACVIGRVDWRWRKSWSRISRFLLRIIALLKTCSF